MKIRTNKKTLVLLLFLVLQVAAQTAERPDSEWKQVAPEGDEFAVDMPANIEASVFGANTEASWDIRTYGFRAVSNSNYFFLFSMPKEDKPHYGSVRSVLGAFLTANHSKSEEVRIAAYSGDFFSFKDSEGFFNKILVINSKERHYVFHTVSEKEHDHSIERFFKSIQLDRVIKKPSTSTPEKDSKRNGTQPAGAPKSDGSNKTLSIGNGAGSGSGNGIGDSSGTVELNANNSEIPTLPSLSPNQSTSLNLLAKPRPVYSQMARTYSVNGIVTLRVVFKADGRIGSITAIERLPFGLTENAIKAANQIKFVPKANNGRYVTVSKQIQYSFTIY